MTEMRGCAEFWKTMPEGNPESNKGSGELVHLRDCPACARRWEQQRALVAGLKAVAAESHHGGAPARVEARLVAAFREHAGLGQPAGLPAGRPRMWIPVVTWFAAAAAVAALALMLVNNREPLPVRHSAPAGIQTASMPAGADWDAADDSPYNSEDFIPLPNAERIQPNENVNLVRVEVPRSTMIALGYDVSADRASEPVEAEIVLGPDGLARAVRFVDE